MLKSNLKTKMLLVPNSLIANSESCETLLSSVSKKDNAIRELEEKWLTFESRVLLLKQENDPLGLS